MASFRTIDFQPTRATLRSFGFIACAAFAAVSGLAWWEKGIFSVGLGALREPVTLGFLLVAALSAAFSLFYQRGNWLLYVGMSILTFPIGFVVSHVILMLLFVLVIGPIAIVLRLIGRDRMARSFRPDAGSYWIDRSKSGHTPRYFRQF